MKKIFKLLVVCFILVAVLSAGLFLYYYFNQAKILREMVDRFSADTRVANAIVTKKDYDSNGKNISTTIKFLEYDTKGNPLKPKYFTFKGDILQFQSLVIRFEDELIANNDKLRGKSLYLFWKVFRLAGKDTQEYAINSLEEVPLGYKANGPKNVLGAIIWQKFWEYALDSEKAAKLGIKNAQIEAPGTRFEPGILYTLEIEHDGGIRIDAEKLPEILEK